MSAIVSFTSDFGLRDAYVGTVKAVMLGIRSDLTIVDVTHAVANQNITEAVFLTQQAWPYFPRGSVHLVVVDPGVGTARRALAIRTSSGFCVGPDNGVLSAACPESARPSVGSQKSIGSTTGAPGVALYAASRIPAPPDIAVREVIAPAVLRPTRSATFHGRDIFGPAAAHLAAGFPFAEIGPLCRDLLVVPALRALEVNGGLLGRILHVDHFGNVITSIRADDLAQAEGRVVVGDRILPFVRTYAEAEGLVTMIGSAGYLEIALVNGNAAVATGLRSGDAIAVSPT